MQVRSLFYTPGGPHDAAIVIEAEGSGAYQQVHGPYPVVRQREDEIYTGFLDVLCAVVILS